MKIRYATKVKLLSIAVLTAVAACAGAQPFPQKPLRWISPYAPGGGSDLTTRAVARKLGEQLGQNVVVDNRTGASGKIAVELASHAPAATDRAGDEAARAKEEE